MKQLRSNQALHRNTRPLILAALLFQWALSISRLPSLLIDFAAKGSVPMDLLATVAQLFRRACFLVRSFLEAFSLSLVF